jgi:hypothetical protein
MAYVASKMVLHDTIETSPDQDDKPNLDRPYDPQREAELLINPEHGLILYGNLDPMGMPLA